MGEDEMQIAFASHLPAATGPMPTGEALGRLVAHARSTWPGVDLPTPMFLRHLAERVPAGDDVSESLAKLHVADLYLACACAHRVPGAIERFESHVSHSLDAFLRGISGAAASIDDIRQTLRQKLFVPADNDAPKIERYSGKGKLTSWVGVTVQRAALNLLRHDSKHESPADALSDAIPAGANPELDYLKARYRAEFRAAFQNAVAELSQRERVILRHHYVNGLSQDRIARLYKINQASVSRCISGARDSIRKSAERELRKKLAVEASELQSIAALIRSQFDISLARCLES